MIRKKDSHWDETVSNPFMGKIENWGRKIFYRCASLLLGTDRYETYSLKNVRRILIIKEPYRMGDLFQITPTLRALKKQYPSIKISLVIQDRNLPVFKNNRDVDRIFVYRKRCFNRAPWELISFFKQIRDGNFDLAVTLETERIHLTNDLIARFSGAPVRARYDGAAFGNEYSNVFYNFLPLFDASNNHKVDMNFGVFKSLGLILEDRSLVFEISDGDVKRAQDIVNGLLHSKNLSDNAGLTVIHPGSYKIHNRWPLENYLRVGHQLLKRNQAVIFILGPAEEGWKEEIEREGFPVVSGISLSEMAGIFSLSKQVLCNDTGVMHISGAVQTKTLALFGETDPERWKPPGPHVTAMRSPDKKIFSVRTDQVIAKLTS